MSKKITVGNVFFLRKSGKVLLRRNEKPIKRGWIEVGEKPSSTKSLWSHVLERSEKKLGSM